MIQLRYPVGLGIVAVLLVGFSIALAVRAADTLALVNGALSNSPGGQPSREEFLAYSMGYHLQDSLVRLVPWVVLAAALTGLGALVLVAIRSRQAMGGGSPTRSRDPVSRDIVG